MKNISKRTVHETEPIFEKYVLSLAPELIDMLKSGEKIKTYRLGMKYDYLKIGDNVRIINTNTREFAFEAKIINKTKSKFSDLPINSIGHETYESKEQQREVFNGYYAYKGKSISDDDLFLIVEFRKIGD